jgi:chromosome segregation ATPase
MTEVLDAIKALEEKLTGKLDDLDHKFERRLNILRQEVAELRPLLFEIAQEMRPDITANRHHLEKLEREQEKFNLRLENVERRIAGMGR